MKKSYDLTILNNKFTIKSDDDEKHVKKVADYVNKKMHSIVGANRAVSTMNVAMMAALNIADDFLKFKRKKKETASKWIEKVQALINRVDGS